MPTIYPSLNAAIQALQLQGFSLVAQLPTTKIERRKGRWVVLHG